MIHWKREKAAQLAKSAGNNAANNGADLFHSLFVAGK